MSNKLVVKLKLNTSLAIEAAQAAARASPAPSSAIGTAASTTMAQTPKSATASTPKIKLSLKNTKKTATTPGPQSATTPKTPILRITNNASKPHRHAGKRILPLGSGYDSEASDKEEDPAIEEQFILRMEPGEDCDYLRHAIENKEMGPQTDVYIKFKDSRRAVVCVRGHLYSAKLVDLPCIIESSKTLDKKNIFKTADICQMLLVEERIITEEQAMSLSVGDHLHPHGIAPPLQWVRKRRFRKRMSNRKIEEVEAQVERLLEADAEAVSTKYELLERVESTRGNSVAMDSPAAWGDEYGDEDAEGEDVEIYNDGEDEDAEGEEEDEMDEDAFMTQLESTMAGEPANTGGEGTATGVVSTNATTPAGANTGKSGESSDEDDDEEEEEEYEEYEEGSDMDEDAQEAAQEKQKLKEEITDVEDMIKTKTRELDGATNSLIRTRIKNQIQGLKSELELKKQELTGEREE